jgi:hypothetical protein
MKSFSKFVGRFPFSGKVSIRMLAFGLYHSTSTTARRWNYFFLMALLILFVVLHGVQMKMGIEALYFESPVWAKVISATYAFANFSVALTQAYLIWRVTRFFLRGLYPRMKRRCIEYSGNEVAVMFAVTIAGQIIFVSQYIHYGR